MKSRQRETGQACLIWPLYVVAEKILSLDETLPDEWAVFGTTGYDFLNAVNGLFVDRRSRRAFDSIYASFAGEVGSFQNLLDAAKKKIMQLALVSELNTLSYQLERIAKKNRRYRDFTLNSLTFAIREIIACLSVYRTYISGIGAPVAQRDQRYVETAVATAKRLNPGTAESIFDFVCDVLLLRNTDQFDKEGRERLLAFVLKFQQLTGPVMAKALEDTIFYVYNRLISLNEVGGNPTRFGISVQDFHYQNVVRQSCQPHSLLATATHDTKRGEDVRARINVLSEIPDEWASALRRWSSLNAYKKTIIEGHPAPDSNDEYLLYQTLLGAWPAEVLPMDKLAEFRERVVSYMTKATREAKIHTSWISPNERYEEATRSFIQKLLVSRTDDAFLNDFRGLQRRVAYYGEFNSLAQTLLKLTCPGVPDLYQGTELLDLSLVDPDNRRPVDYELRRASLGQLIDRVSSSGEDLLSLVNELLNTVPDSRAKLYVTHRALTFRRNHPDLFSFGAYLPLDAQGPRRDYLCAFARTSWDETSLTIVPRLVVRLTEGVEQPPIGADVWKNTWLILPNDRVGFRYRDVLTGEILQVERRKKVTGLPVASILAHFPAALLERLR
jgi:(1->4)-alpha-D-glucan 1-alpha-D-glucosylmutase